MRRILLFVTLISLLISNMGISGVFAVEYPVVTPKSSTPLLDSTVNPADLSLSDVTNSVASQTNNSPATTTSSTNSKITVITTEEIPGGGCVCKDEKNTKCDKIETRKYECTVTSGMSAFQGIMGTLIKWFIYIIMLLGVLAIVGAGIMMTFGSDSEEYTKKAKGWAMNIIIGLVILFTFSYILKLLAPWIYQ